VDILNEIYNKLQTPVYKMTVHDRCDLQKLFNRAIREDDVKRFLCETDRKNFLHHIAQFEADILLIDSKIRQRILGQAASIQVAINAISDICKTE
jgi:hypothetical protein